MSQHIKHGIADSLGQTNPLCGAAPDQSNSRFKLSQQSQHAKQGAGLWSYHLLWPYSYSRFAAADSNHVYRLSMQSMAQQPCRQITSSDDALAGQSITKFEPYQQSQRAKHCTSNLVPSGVSHMHAGE